MKTTTILFCLSLWCAYPTQAAEPTFQPGPQSGQGKTASDLFNEGVKQSQASRQRAQQMQIQKEKADRERQALEVEQRLREAKAKTEIAEQEERQRQLREPEARLDALFEKPDARATKTLTERLKAGQVVLQNYAGIKKLMSHDEFTKAGLTKLGDDEIKALDGWILKHTLKVAKAGAAKSELNNSDSVIETQIEGDFEGWSGDTIWKMTNGQIWQQAEYDYNYSYAYRPEVLIYRGSGGWKMKVEDESEEIAVKRIK